MLPFELPPFAKMFFSPPCQPNDHCDSDPMGLLAFLGVKISEVLLVTRPAGMSSMINKIIKKAGRAVLYAIKDHFSSFCCFLPGPLKMPNTLDFYCNFLCFYFIFS